MTTFLVLLRFVDPAARAAAPAHLDGHRDWIAAGRADGTFLVVGALVPDVGGAIIARGEAREAIAERVAQDPFVVHGIVSAEVLEFAPALVDDALRALLPQEPRSSR